jgi:4-aminobutyrate aminotransferase-like enzyme
MLSQSDKMSAQEIVGKSREYRYSHGRSRGRRINSCGGGEGVYFWDAIGKRYLDFSSQLMN